MKIRITKHDALLVIDGVRKFCPFDNIEESTHRCGLSCALFSVEKYALPYMAPYLEIKLCHKTYTVDAEDFINEYRNANEVS